MYPSKRFSHAFSFGSLLPTFPQPQNDPLQKLTHTVQSSRPQIIFAILLPFTSCSVVLFVFVCVCVGFVPAEFCDVMVKMKHSSLDYY